VGTSLAIQCRAARTPTPTPGPNIPLTVQRLRNSAELRRRWTVRRVLAPLASCSPGLG
jgi:hypothetical protein